MRVYHAHISVSVSKDKFLIPVLETLVKVFGAAIALQTRTIKRKDIVNSKINVMDRFCKKFSNQKRSITNIVDLQK